MVASTDIHTPNSGLYRHPHPQWWPLPTSAPPMVASTDIHTPNGGRQQLHDLSTPPKRLSWADQQADSNVVNCYGPSDAKPAIQPTIRRSNRQIDTLKTHRQHVINRSQSRKEEGRTCTKHKKTEGENNINLHTCPHNIIVHAQQILGMQTPRYH